MYCKNCGNEIKEDSKFCPKCGEKINSDSYKNVMSTVNKRNVKKSIILLIGIVTVFVLAVIWIISSRKTDLERMVGTWNEEEGNLVLTIYEPDNEEKNMGATEIIENDEIIYGTYEWEENAKRIILSGTDNWGDTVDVSYKYEFNEVDEIVLTAVENPDKVVYLKKEK